MEVQPVNALLQMQLQPNVSQAELFIIINVSSFIGPRDGLLVPHLVSNAANIQMQLVAMKNAAAAGMFHFFILGLEIHG